MDRRGALPVNKICARTFGRLGALSTANDQAELKHPDHHKWSGLAVGALLWWLAELTKR